MVAVDVDQMMKMENNLKFDELDLELKNYAKENSVRIIQDEGLSFLESMVRIKRPNVILEVGTAIGYSAIRMIKAGAKEVYTIERDPKMYEEAVKNVEKAGFSDRIHILFKDALEAYDLVKDVKIDMLFIDAAKAQYTKFFDIYTKNLNEHGIVVCDNMLFHGMVENKNLDEMTRGVRGLVRKLNMFHEFLLSNDLYDTSIYDIGDGMAISIKK